MNLSIFSCGIGFRILVVLFVVRGGWRASRVFGGMWSVTGEWYEFKLWSLLILDVYRVLSSVFILSLFVCNYVLLV